ncbi:MAG TPA: hypothetical protein P5111_09415, partial [Kiritimatiellia bacterium]|nr:hypothetical protein [Kiritimatiellia bacterium]
SYINTTYNSKGLHYTYRGGLRTMPVSGGKRVHDGTGDAGSDAFDLNPVAGSTWDLAGLYDAESGTIGGGGVEGVLYVSVLVRAHYTSDGTSERKTGELPYGRHFGFSLWRGTGTEILGMGNEWGAYAYSIFGVTGKQDLRDASGGTTYINVDRDVRLMVARIAFHAHAADDIAVWLDPDPARGDDQEDDVRRYLGTAKGDLSFDRVAYRAGNIPVVNGVDFDEVRFGTDWDSVAPGVTDNVAFWYDGQSWFSTYVNTTFDRNGLSYTMANGGQMPVSGGKRVTPGTGESGADILPLNPTAGSVWDQVGLYDSVSGLIGGGEVSRVLYFSALVRSVHGASTVTEPKDNGTNSPPFGMEAFVQITRPGLGSLGALGMGNGWNQWAYSIGGVFGSTDLKQTNGTTFVSVNTATRWMVAKITFKHMVPDTATIWLDPNPDHGDNQAGTVCRATVNGDFSFNQLAFRSGNIPGLNSWEFDEVRFATDWRGTVTNLPSLQQGVILKVR